MENRSRRGGGYENVGEGWQRYSSPPVVRMRCNYYEEDPKVIYGPKGDVIGRVVNKAPKMGFRHQENNE